ncbi:sulfotransferase [Francisella philomiragia]|uniref:sulfotransferase n=1 Tax=Francisella philomiragia TaxID=28110 RepID=UPI0035116629
MIESIVLKTKKLIDRLLCRAISKRKMRIQEKEIMAQKFEEIYQELKLSRNYMHSLKQAQEHLVHVLDILKNSQSQIALLTRDVDTKIESLDTKIESLDTKIESLDTKIESLDTKIVSLDTKIVSLAKDINTKIDSLYVKDRTKYFCIGRNKTGTTSLKKAFEDLGFIVGDQREAEWLFDKYFFDNKFNEIVEYCKSAEVFQDVPFSHLGTFVHLDRAYPGSKFILTLRDSPEQWYNSITKFHGKLFGKGGRVPTYEDLANAEYVRKGFMTRIVDGHGTSAKDPYNKEIMIEHYNRHNQSIIDYFKDRPDDLLVINLSEKSSYQKFCEFIGRECSADDTFPWENKT